MQEELTSLGTNISEQDFSATILGLLPKCYGQFISAITATASVLKQELNPDSLTQTIIDEYHCQSTRPGAKEKGTDAMFFAENIRGKPGKRSNKDIKCYNYHKKGHKKAECWAKGGRKKGQGPRSKARKDKKKPKKETASAVVEGVWMAITNDSGDEQMADNKFDDFTISEEELFFKDEDRNIMDLTTCLKQLLKIPNSPEYATYPYDNLNYFLNPHNFTNSSDDKDNAGAVTITIELESEEEEEINPYWTKIKVDKLQGIGNPMEVIFSNTDSIPDLESVSVSEDSMIFILTPPNSTDTDNEE